MTKKKTSKKVSKKKVVRRKFTEKQKLSILKRANRIENYRQAAQDADISHPQMLFKWRVALEEAYGKKELIKKIGKY